MEKKGIDWKLETEKKGNWTKTIVEHFKPYIFNLKINAIIGNLLLFSCTK